MANISGPFTALSASTNDFVGEWHQHVLVRNARGANQGASPILYGLMSRLKVEAAESPRFNWFEREPVVNNIYINNGAGYSASATTLAVDDGASGSVYALFDDGDVLFVTNAAGLPTEQIIVTGAQTVTDSLIVTRGFAGTTPVVLADNTMLSVVSRAKVEGALQSVAGYQDPTVLYNYVQIFNRTNQVTNVYKGSQLRTDIEGPVMERRMYALEAIGRDIESAFFMGQPTATATSTGTRYTTGGVYAALNSAGLTNNILNGGGTAGVTISQLMSWTQSFQTYGSDNKICFCGPGFYTAFSSYTAQGANGWRVMNPETRLGIKVTQFVTGYGELNLVQHPLFTQNKAFANWAIVVDLNQVIMKTYEPLHLEENTQTPGQDSYYEQFRAKYGLKLEFAQAHGAAYNFSKIIAG